MSARPKRTNEFDKIPPSTIKKQPPATRFISF